MPLYFHFIFQPPFSPASYYAAIIFIDISPMPAAILIFAFRCQIFQTYSASSRSKRQPPVMLCLRQKKKNAKFRQKKKKKKKKKNFAVSPKKKVYFACHCHCFRCRHFDIILRRGCHILITLQFRHAIDIFILRFDSFHFHATSHLPLLRCHFRHYWLTIFFHSIIAAIDAAAIFAISAIARHHAIDCCAALFRFQIILLSPLIAFLRR